ncbi:hypothetical protein ACIOKA_37790 [Streptomyces anulatus]
MTRKTQTKKRPTPAPTKPATIRPVLPVRPATPGPEFITEQQMNAAYNARLNGLPLMPITAWAPLPDGTVRAHLPGGVSLTHGPTGFTAHTPCPNGARHHTPIANGQDLRNATATVGRCTDLHGQARTLTLAQAVATTADTQTLDVTNLRSDTDQAKEHPQP